PDCSSHASHPKQQQLPGAPAPPPPTQAFAQQQPANKQQLGTPSGLVGQAAGQVAGQGPGTGAPAPSPSPLWRPEGNLHTAAESLPPTPQHNSHLRYAGRFLLPATSLSPSSCGPAVWQTHSHPQLASALLLLLSDPVQRHSRGHAAAQGAAKLASGLVHTVWNVVDDVVISQALNSYVLQKQGREEGGQGA
ncbi:hypothetical protein QJQ45_021603, partial [Haematococcus lacustris]